MREMLWRGYSDVARLRDAEEPGEVRVKSEVRGLKSIESWIVGRGRVEAEALWCIVGVWEGGCVEVGVEVGGVEVEVGGRGEGEEMGGGGGRCLGSRTVCSQEARRSACGGLEESRAGVS